MATIRSPARIIARRLPLLCLVIAVSGRIYADGVAAQPTVTYAQPALPAQPSTSSEPSIAATNLERWEPLPPPEIPLFAMQEGGRSLAIPRAIAMAGSGGGIVVTALGLYTIATSISAGLGSAAAHDGIAIAVSGSLVAAISSTVLSMLANAISPASAE